jgi:integrase
MASAGIRKNRNGTRYQVWWRLDDGTQGSRTFDSRGLARDFKNELLAQAAANAWVDPRRGRILFDDWADHWWRLWSASPRRSPKGMETTDSHLRCHLRRHFGRRQLRQITPSMVLRWQHELEEKLSHSGVMACRSILLRILEAARKERLIATNPVREVEAPKPRLNPEQVFGHQRRRTLTPEEFGCLVAACRPFYRDHFLIQVGTGLRNGELLGLRRLRVFPELGRIEVIEVRYEAGRFGRGLKAEPKSLASVRVVPMCHPVREAIARQLTVGAGPEDLVLPGPGAVTASPAAPGRRCRPPTCGGSTSPPWRRPGRSWLTWTCAVPVTCGIPSRPGWRTPPSPPGWVMVARVTAALDERIGHALAVAAYLLREGLDSRAVDGGEGL